jgi:hypothetical protein
VPAPLLPLLVQAVLTAACHPLATLLVSKLQRWLAQS